MNLEDHFPGDRAWKSYVKSCRPQWNKFRGKAELIEFLAGCEDVAIVCYVAFPCNLYGAIKEKVPALNGLSIVDCCEGEKIKRVKSMLLRLH